MATIPTPKAPKYPTIPLPEDNLHSLHRTCLALKRSVEMLTGKDTKSADGTATDRFAPHVFITPYTPEALHIGDFWLCTGQNYTFNMWNGGTWLVICTLPPQGMTFP
jgi:hypothetical protein